MKIKKEKLFEKYSYHDANFNQNFVCIIYNCKSLVLMNLDLEIIKERSDIDRIICTNKSFIIGSKTNGQSSGKEVFQLIDWQSLETIQVFNFQTQLKNDPFYIEFYNPIYKLQILEKNGIKFYVYYANLSLIIFDENGYFVNKTSFTHHFTINTDHNNNLIVDMMSYRHGLNRLIYLNSNGKKLKETIIKHDIEQDSNYFILGKNLNEKIGFLLNGKNRYYYLN